MKSISEDKKFQRSNDVEVCINQLYGYYQLADIPVSDTLTRYYESHYYDPLRKTPLHESSEQLEKEFVRQSAELSRGEKTWRVNTEYQDIVTNVSDIIGNINARILDVGAGIGELMGAFAAMGFKVSGIEPSREACLYAKSQGIKNLHEHTIETWLKDPKSVTSERADVITLLNVLEHVPDPEAVIKSCFTLLADFGLVCIRVPNDFSKIQDAVVQKYGCKKWWIVSPDHVNYFNLNSLTNLLTKNGFEIVMANSDFPIDWFLLMGDNYIDDPEIGTICHERRRNFELSLPNDVRKHLYRCLGEAGFGRNLIVYAKKKG